MKASSKRNLVRWIHIAVGSIIATYIYSPLGEIVFFQILTKAIIIHLTAISGIWLWKGHLLRKLTAKAKTGASITILLPLLFLAFTGFNKNEKAIVLKINNVKKPGKLFVTFCTKASEWSSNGKYSFQFDNPAKGTNTYELKNIPNGLYAVAIFQDINGNGKLDNNFFGKPKEPFAFSNNIKPGLSAPGFDECSFQFTEAKQILLIDMIN